MRYDIPLPFWLYAYGAAAAVVLTFLLLMNARPVPHRYPRFDLLQIGWFRAVFARRPLLLVLRLLSVALFFLVIFSGLIGNQTPEDNFAPTFVWVIWWVGLAFLTALIGNLWGVVNPWRITFGWVQGLAHRVGTKKGLEPYLPYPAGWGVWPALALYFGFVWVELVFLGSARPSNIAVLAIVYSAITWGGMLIFGKDAWLRGARRSPSSSASSGGSLRPRCGWTTRRSARAAMPPAETPMEGASTATNASPEPPPKTASSTCAPRARSRSPGAGRRGPPGIRALRAGQRHLRRADGYPTVAPSAHARRLGHVHAQHLGHRRSLHRPDVGPDRGAAALSRCILGLREAGAGLQRGRYLDLAARAAYVYTLVPIALACQAAHYYTLLVIQGQSLVALISDPFGRGWDLFGTAGYEPNVGVLSADFVWYSQVALIVAGHMIAVYLAHGISLRLLGDKKRVVRSQYPLLALMVLYTVFSLWILNQPVVEENELATVTRGDERSELAWDSIERAPYAASSRARS